MTKPNTRAAGEDRRRRSPKEKNSQIFLHMYNVYTHNVQYTTYITYYHYDSFKLAMNSFCLVDSCEDRLGSYSILCRVDTQCLRSYTHSTHI